MSLGVSWRRPSAIPLIRPSTSGESSRPRHRVARIHSRARAALRVIECRPRRWRWCRLPDSGRKGCCRYRAGRGRRAGRTRRDCAAAGLARSCRAAEPYPPSLGLPFQRARIVAATGFVDWPSRSIESSWRRKVVKSLGEILGSLTTAPVTRSGPRRSPRRGLSCLPGARPLRARCSTKKAATTSRCVRPVRRSDETNDARPGRLPAKQAASRRVEAFGEQNAARTRRGTRPKQRLPGGNGWVLHAGGGDCFFGWAPGPFVPAEQGGRRRKTIASLALVYIVGRLCRHLFRGKNEPMLCAPPPKTGRRNSPPNTRRSEAGSWIGTSGIFSPKS